MEKLGTDPYVFISYKTEDRPLAQKVRTTLGYINKCTIWWDQHLQTGGQWAAELDTVLRDASCVVVLWTERSVRSPWVQQEAAIAKALGKLVPVRLDECTVPPPYNDVQTALLMHWNGEEDDPQFVRLAQGVRVHLDATRASLSTVKTKNASAEIEEVSPVKDRGGKLKTIFSITAKAKYLGFLVISIILLIIAFIVIIASNKKWTREKYEVAIQECANAYPPTASDPFYACVLGLHSYGNIRTLLTEWTAQKTKVECELVCNKASTNQTPCKQGCHLAFLTD